MRMLLVGMSTLLCSSIAMSEEDAKSTMEIYGFAMMDTGYQSKQNDPDWFDVVRPTKLPSFENEFGADEDWFASVRQSRFGVKTSTPTGLGGSSPNQTTVNLSWNASSDNVAVTGYRVYRNGSHVANSATTSYSDGSRTPCTQYSYQVAAYDAATNVSGLSSAINVFTLDQTAPSAPTGLTAVAASPSRINLSWAAASDVGCGVIIY